MKVTFASILFLITVVTNSAEARKSARHTRAYHDAEDDADGRALKGSGKNSNIFSHCSKSARGTNDCTAHPSGMPSDVPSLAPSASPSLAPSVISDPPSSDPSAEPSQSPSSTPSVSNAPTMSKGSKGSKGARRRYGRRL